MRGRSQAFWRWWVGVRDEKAWLLAVAVMESARECRYTGHLSGPRAADSATKRPRTIAINGNSNNELERKLWAAADKLRGHLDAAEYKHVVLGLIFLKYISDAFQELHDDLAARQETEYSDPEDRDEYLAENVFWVPKEARWAKLQANAKRPRSAS